MEALLVCTWRMSGLRAGPRLLQALVTGRASRPKLVPAPPARSLRHLPSLAVPSARRWLGSPSRAPAAPRAAADTHSSAAGPMAAPAAADGAAAAAPPLLASTLPDELKAQFSERVRLTALVVPKQRTTEYMKLLSKWALAVGAGGWKESRPHAGCVWRL